MLKYKVGGNNFLAIVGYVGKGVISAIAVLVKLYRFNVGDGIGQLLMSACELLLPITRCRVASIFAWQDSRTFNSLLIESSISWPA